MKNKKYANVKGKTIQSDNEECNGTFSSPKIGLIIILAIIFSLLHRNHISQMFESDRHFSHLSALERELAFRTEMGLYYSYYKTIIEAKSFVDGMNLIMRDNVTEFPLVINTLKRFNLYPEVILGAAYLTYTGIADRLNIKTKMCWSVNRGENLSTVESCEGLGEPSYFYIEWVFLINGLNMGLVFIFATYLSGSIFGGLIACMCFFYNHGECTRVQWTPPLRENFAYPFLVLQMFIVTIVIRSRTRRKFASLLIGLVTASFMLPWQFAQFALLTQSLSIFGTYLLKFTDSQTMKTILKGQALGLFLSVIFLFGNEMLLTSFFTASLVAIFIVLLAENFLNRLNLHPIVLMITKFVLMIGMTVIAKMITSRILSVHDDEHIGDIFRSKFSDFKNFHTMLYTCAAEFDFMESATPVRLTKTLLLPTCLLAVFIVTYKILISAICNILWPLPENNNTKHLQSSKPKSNGFNNDKSNGDKTYVDNSSSYNAQEIENSLDGGEHIYHVMQLVAFTAMAIIIMRLKLFWTPHLCLLSSMIASRQYFSWIGSKQRHHICLALLLGLMTVQGWSNLQQQWNIRGEFSNIEMEELVEWINKRTLPNAVFAGPMPTMATVKLCTGRPIINHPHYEDVGLRARTKLVYSMFSRKDVKEVWQNFKTLGADYVIVEEQWCFRRSKPGCGMADIWDLEDVENQERVPVCQRLYENSLPYFKTVFQNPHFLVLKVIKKPKF